MTYFDNIQVAASRLLNAIVGGRYDQMLSSRAWEMHLTSNKWNIVKCILDVIFYWDKGQHCKINYEWEYMINHNN